MENQKSPRIALSLGSYWNARIDAAPNNHSTQTLLMTWAKSIKRAMEMGARGCVVALLHEERDYIVQGVHNLKSPRRSFKDEYVVDVIYNVHTHDVLEHSSQSKLQRIVKNPVLIQCLRKLISPEYGLCVWFQSESKGRGLIANQHMLPRWLELYVYWSPENQMHNGVLYAYWLSLMTKGDDLQRTWAQRIRRAMDAGQRMIALFTIQRTIDYESCTQHFQSPLRCPSVRNYVTQAEFPNVFLCMNARHKDTIEWVTLKQSLNWCVLLEDNCDSGVLAVYRC